MHIRSALLAVTVSTITAQALSTQCTTQIGALALLGEIGTCLQLTSALNLLQSSGSVIDDLNSYLNTLCASSTPTCSDSALTSAESTIASACSSDLSGGGTEATEVEAVQSILQSYPQVKTAACSKNSTTNQFCVTDTLQTVQDVTGQNVTTSLIFSLLGGSSVDGLDSALSSGQLCTGCVGEIYYQARQANSSVANTSIGQGLSNQCGSSFGTSQPSDVAATSATAASSSAAASSSGAAISAKSIIFTPYVVAAATVVFGSIAGAALL